FQSFTVTANSRGFRFRFEAEVVQIFPAADGYGSAFQLCGWTAARARELERKLKGGGEEDASVVSPVFRIKKMDVNERFRLATTASRPERQILLRDGSPQVLLGLLVHPRIEDREIKAIVESPSATGAIMKRVAANRKWMANPEIQLAVVRSPKTPPPIAIQLMPTLRTSDLQVLAKGSASRENVRKAALRVYLQRTGRG
ncbi:MAG: hypothetical protein V3T72_04080, partial [Thermoanaerobaculia bacterium]